MMQYNFKNGDVIFEETINLNTLFIIYQGEIKLIRINIKNNFKQTIFLKRGCIFGNLVGEGYNYTHL